jgi:hypothetical protein
MPVPRVCGRIGTKEVVLRVKKILNGMPPALTEGFNRFLPPDHQIRTEKFSLALDLVQKIRERFSPEHPEVPDAPSLPAGLAMLSRARRTLTAAPHAPPLPQVLEEFLSALHAFQSDRTSLAEARSQVTAALHGHDDLIHDFVTFLPLRAEQEMAQGLSKRRRPCTSIAAARALRPGRRRCAAEGNTLLAGRAACAASRAGAGARTGLDESRKRRREQLVAEAERRWRTRLPSIADVKLRRAVAAEGAAPPGDAPDGGSLAASEPARRAGRKQSAPRRAPAAGGEAAGGAAAHAPLFLVQHPPRGAQPLEPLPFRQARRVAPPGTPAPDASCAALRGRALTGGGGGRERSSRGFSPRLRSTACRCSASASPTRRAASEAPPARAGTRRRCGARGAGTGQGLTAASLFYSGQTVLLSLQAGQSQLAASFVPRV